MVQGHDAGAGVGGRILELSKIEGAMIEGLSSLLTKLEKAAGKYRKVDGTVGYSAVYALAVHEDLQRFHPNGQAKYLEQPARQYQAEMAKIVRDQMQAGASLEDAIREALEFLKVQSQALVPVLTGALRDSAYVDVRTP